MEKANSFLDYEKKWYSSIQRIHRDLEEEIADNLDGLPVDENGIYTGKASADEILFNGGKAKSKMREAAKKLITETVKHFGERAGEDIGWARGHPGSVKKRSDIGLTFNMDTKPVRDYINTRSYHFANEATDTLLQRLRTIWNDNLKLGIADRKAVWELTEDVENTFRGTAREEWFRARRIARTEAVGSANMASELAYDQAGVPGSMWITSRDSRVRDIHQPMDGVVKKAGGDFVVGGKNMRAPGDPRGGPENICNCRCTIVPVFQEEGAEAVAPVSPTAVPAKEPAIPKWAQPVADIEYEMMGFDGIKSSMWKRNKVSMSYFGRRTEGTEIMSKTVAMENDRINRLCKFHVSENLKSIQFVDELTSDSSTALGTWNRQYNRIRMMKMGTRDIQEIADISRGIGKGAWVVDHSVSGTYRHEVGHMFFDKHISGMDRRRWINMIKKEGRQWVKKNVSEYAGTSGTYLRAGASQPKFYYESFAESWAAYTHESYRKGLLPAKIEQFLENAINRKAAI